jgi:hypothetical protein
MAGLVPAIHALFWADKEGKRRCPGIGEPKTPSFGRLWASESDESVMAAATIALGPRLSGAS